MRTILRFFGDRRLRVALYLIVVAAGGGAIGLWVMTPSAELWEWVGRILLPLVAIDLGWLLYRTRPPRTEALPDPLREIAGGYYEHRGMCFAPKFVVKDGLCWLHLYVQNRYARGGEVRIMMRVHGRHMPADVDEQITCGGGALVVLRIPYAVPRELGGRQVTYELTAMATYPGGTGKLLHFREGTRVSSGGTETNPLPFGCTLALVLALVGRYWFSRSEGRALYGDRLPAVQGDVPDDLPGEQETLWEPDLPTGGFPVGTGR